MHQSQISDKLCVAQTVLGTNDINKRKTTKSTSYQRAGLNVLFELKNPLVEYSPNTNVKVCADLDCMEKKACWCSLCSCCSVCSSKCSCSEAITEPNKKLAELLGFGDSLYR